MRRWQPQTLAWMVALALVFGIQAHVSAQTLIWNLPAEGSWVRFQGTFEQTEARPGAAGGDLELPPWSEQVTIKALGSEMAEVAGEQKPCRWIEIRIERGKEVDGKLDTGLAGLEIYKVLVPETAIPQGITNQEGIPLSFLPVVKGYRKVGSGEITPIVSPALQLYPLGVLAGYYRTMTVGNAPEDLSTPAGPQSATKYEGKLEVERAGSRTQEDSTIWRSAEIPFGVAGWTANVVRQVKDERAPRDDFKTVSTVKSSVRLSGTGTDATSDLPDSN